MDEFEVYVTRNGEMIQSEQSNSRPSSRDNNTIYVGTRVNGSEEIGYEYDYTLYRESFRQEGIYNIMFYSRDAAGNEVNNTLTEKKAELTIKPEQALRVMKVMEAAFESAEKDEVINLSV